MWSDGDDSDWEYDGHDDDIDWYDDDYSPPPSRIVELPDFTLHKPKLDEDRHVAFEVPSLVDIVSRFVALKFPFAYIEHRNPPVPEELQLKVIWFSFPDNEAVVRKHAEFSGHDFKHDRLENECVKNLRQIGGWDLS